MTGKASVGEERKRKKDDKSYNLQAFMLKEECKSWHAQTMPQLLAPRLSVRGGRVPQQLCMGEAIVTVEVEGSTSEETLGSLRTRDKQRGEDRAGSMF